MSIVLLITEQTDGQPITRLVPVATQQVFLDRWLPGARTLGLELVELMETGFDVTFDNVDELRDELRRLRKWMDCAPVVTDYDRQRLDTLLMELSTLRLGDGVTAFLG